ncbi:MAG: phage major capsid protein [Acidobacteria bacterium]|nr:phage major capsid protein [Acidobacteriota bacterium]
MTREQISERREALLDKVESIQADIKTTEHGSERERRLNRGVSKIIEEINQLDEREAVLKAERAVEIQAGMKSGKYAIERGDGFDLDRDPIRDHKDVPYFTGSNPWDSLESGVLGRSVSVDEAKSRALSAVEVASGLSDASRSKATGLIENQDPDGVIARYALVTSDPDYLSAFSQMMRDTTPLLTDPEIRAARRVREFGRAMSLTDSEGGFLVPFQLDPSVIMTDDLGISDIRRISKTVVATGDVWNGVASGAVSWSWDVEAAEVSDDATTFTQPTVVIHKAQGFVPISIEALADEANVTEAVTTLLVDGRNDLEGTALTLGTGSGQPFGIIVAVTAGALSSASTDAFAIADVYALHDALPARFAARSTWLASPLAYSLIRQMGTDGSPAPFLTESAGNLLLEAPTATSSYMDGVINAGQTNLLLLLGDFSNYVIADRIGMQVEMVPHIFSTSNNRPTGQRGFYAYYRTGADSVNDSAFELLDVT